MKNKAKKLLCVVAAATMLASTLSLTACGDYHDYDKLDGYVSTGEVVSNGGFAVEKGEYVYFINGAEDYTADNTFGTPVKGALMRIKKSALKSGASYEEYTSAEVVVPMLIAPNHTSGIYIFGDYVYYATPSTDTEVGTDTINNTDVEFKRAKLDGSETMKDYYFRIASEDLKNFRFVEEGETVYCLYEEGTSLKSYNTTKRKTTLLVKDASGYYYDKTEGNLDSGNVYYTMSVSENIETTYNQPLGYNQIYCVNAAATSVLDSKNAKYTVKDENGTDYKTYDFDGAALEKNYEDFFDRKDISTYPYVNLGKLVVDGVGKKSPILVGNLPFNDSADEYVSTELKGYTYSIVSYQNGGVYYTKASADESASMSELLFYKPQAGVSAVEANKKAIKIAEDTTNVSAALFLSETSYLYTSDSYLYRQDSPDENGVIPEPLKLADIGSSRTLWRTVGDFVYYYGSTETSTTSGYEFGCINYKGTADNYHDILVWNEENKDYRPVTLNYVDIYDSWYAPELVTVDGENVLLYPNANLIGEVTYNYVYKTTLSNANGSLVGANNEAYKASKDYMNEDLTLEVRDAAEYFFRTYKRELLENQKFYEDWNELLGLVANGELIVDWTDDFVKADATDTEENGAIWKFTAGGLKVESDFINMIGALSEDDQEAIEEAWRAKLPFKVEEETEEEGLAWWVITLIVVGSVLVAATAAVIPVIIIRKKKAAAEAEATVNAYKRVKIDTTDDKSIDVYANDEASESNESNE